MQAPEHAELGQPHRVDVAERRHVALALERLPVAQDVGEAAAARHRHVGVDIPALDEVAVVIPGNPRRGAELDDFRCAENWGGGCQRRGRGGRREAG